MNTTPQQFNTNAEHDETAEELARRASSIRGRVMPDSRFATQLREDLATRASSRRALHTLQKSISKPLTFFSFMNKFILPLVAVAIVAASGGYYISERNSEVAGLKQFTDQMIQADYAVAEVPANSFGSLVTLASTNQVANGTGGGNLVAPNTTGATAETTPAQTLVGDSKLPIDPGTGGGSSFVPEYYEFSYTGSALDGLLNETQSVYQRTKIESNTSSIDALLRSFTFGLIDLSQLDNAKLQNFSVSQENGFDAYVDFREQAINMYKNGNYSTMSSRVPESYQQLKIEDFPANEVIIAATDAFLDEYKVSRSGYGTPTVDQQWRRAFTKPNELSYPAYVPEVVDVVYPFLIDGKATYDESGYLAGMHVSYNVRENVVNSMYDLRLRKYQKSDYAGEMNQKRLLDMAQRGGFRNYNYVDPNAKKVTLELGTPTLQVMRFWKYSDNGYGMSQELFVPALVFPIKEQGNYWRPNVVVPLVAEVLDGEDYQGSPMPYSVDTPAMPVATEPAVAGAAILEKK